jgi:hypothetical protein
MRFLQNLLYIDRPSSQSLLDIALVLSIIAHIFSMKLSMFIFLVISLFFIITGKKSKSYQVVLFVLGVVAIVVSFLGNYNFSNFSKMQFYISFISSLLFVAMALQRLTGQINVYLKSTPIMLMLLSFFFYESITMLFYSVFVVFSFSLLMIWERMHTTFVEVFKLNLKLFLLALPAVIILFIAFPRISFKKADFGFRGDSYSISGYSGFMSVSDAPVVNSDKTVIEVMFEDKNINDSQLYFRGSTLYPIKQNHWEMKKGIDTKEYIQDIKQTIDYKMTLHPHGKKWFFAIDVPIKTPKQSKMLYDHTLEFEKPLYKLKRFEMRSALEYKLLTRNADKFLDVDKSLYPRLVESLDGLKNLSQTDKSKALVEFFKSLDLVYSMHPKSIDINNTVESFLYDAKNGYCTHFASSFAIAARIVGIPSRVVSGYKADKTNMIENYLLVKERDAHAWVELYFEKEGWKRFEPTSLAIRTVDAIEGYEKDSNLKNIIKNNELFREINLKYMYVKYLISNWILDFNRNKQMSILERLLNDTIYLLKFVLSIIGLTIVSFLFVYVLKTKKGEDKLSKTMKPLLRYLRKNGYEKAQNETMQHFLLTTQKQSKIQLDSVNTLYNLLKYSDKKDAHLFSKLDTEIDDILKTNR